MTSTNTTSKDTFDAIVIGSGIGGLTAAVELSNRGYSVLVLEQATDFGGYSNPFKRKKFHFDPGIHYLGDLGPGKGFRNTLEKIGVWDRMEFIRLNDDCYDRYVFPELDFHMPAGREKFRDRLLEHFPGAKAGIDKYIAILDALNVDPSDPTAQKKANEQLKKIDSTLPRLRTSTYAEILDHIFDKGTEPLLKAVLGGPCGDIGLPPGRVAATALFGIFNHYVDGAYYPKGGSGALRDAFTGKLEENGAVLKNRTRVTEIITEGGAAAGVRTAAGEEFRADMVISNVDPLITFGKLMNRNEVSPKLLKKAEGMEVSYASYTLFIGTSLPKEKLGLSQENIWYYPSTDIDATYDSIQDMVVPEGDFSFFLSSPSQKDPDSGKCPPGTETLEVVLLADFKPFQKWSGQKAMRREDDYNALKDQISTAIKQQVGRLYAPGLSENIVVEELGTPVTNEFYAAPVRGAIYGPAHTPSQIGLGRFMPRSSQSKNLYLCGAGVFNCGIAPCSISGYYAAELAAREHPRSGRATG